MKNVIKASGLTAAVLAAIFGICVILRTLDNFFEARDIALVIFFGIPMLVVIGLMWTFFYDQFA